MIPRKKLLWTLLPVAAVISMSFAQEVRLPGVQSAEEGNWRRAYDSLRQGLLDKTTPEAQRAEALTQAVQALTQLNRVDEADAFLEAVIEAYPQDPRVQLEAARAYLNLPHYGGMIAGDFQRGAQRGQAEIVNSYQRDRVRVIQLLRKSLALDGQATRGPALRELAETLMGGRFMNQAWQLQLLTNLDKLPDYDEGWGYGSSTQGAPVDADGEPIYYDAAESWDAAKNDGQRWRWAWQEYAGLGDQQRAQATLERAQFLESQFGVQTLAQYMPYFAPPPEEEDTRPSIFTLHTLTDDETIARLATGVRRFKLPDEHNHVRLFQQVLGGEQFSADRSSRFTAAVALANLHQNRRQYPRAAEYFGEALEYADARQRDWMQRSRDQILDAWGEFQPVDTQPSGQGATVEYRFRNGTAVDFVARKVDVRQLLSDVKAYLDSRPAQLEWQQLNIADLGNRLMEEGQDKYLGAEAASWRLELHPPADHFDKMITVTTPLKDPGAYWLTAKMADGNTTHVLLWVADTAILRKPLDGKELYYVADAVTGRPVAGAAIEMFGYRQQQSRNRPNRFQIETLNFAERTDADGMVEVQVDNERTQRNFQWLAIATTEDGRHAYLGFDGIGYSRLVRGTHNQVSAFVVTDRPVYRPGQKVQYKAWVQRAEYGDRQDPNEFARKSFRVELWDGRNEKVQELTLTSNAFGAIEGEYELPEGATLGQYRLDVVGHGGGAFRVEEYKKPEYEVTVDAPSEGVKLGDKFTATVHAKYYFGAPVVNATVKYKVTRTARDAYWYPPGPWDWLYGPGYRLLGVDADWHPGFDTWGLRCPTPPWWPWRRPDPPEIVAEGESPLSAEGTLEIPIDTALAKEIHGDSDHNYHIEAQVVDASRRTIVGAGDVLAARQPFRAYVWTDNGFYRVGDSVEVRVSVRSADSKPLAKSGSLRLLKLSYAEDGSPPQETEVRTWELATDANGDANLQIRASEPGQYRLSFTAPTDDGEQVEGGHIFTIMGEGFDGSGFTFNALEVIPDKAEYAPGEKVRLQINANRLNSAVLLFVRPENGVYPKPQFVRINGKSTVVEVEVAESDMPNLIVEATAIGGAQVHQVLRDIAIPPADKTLKLEVVTDGKDYKPGEEANVTLRLTDQEGLPIIGDSALTIYDKSVEYISGGSNVPDIRKHFWDWRRTHYPNRSDSLARSSYNLNPRGEPGMQQLGVFGGTLQGNADRDGQAVADAAPAPMMAGGRGGGGRFGEGAAMSRSLMAADAPMAEMAVAKQESADADSGGGQLVEPTVRTEFADTALWRGVLQTNSDGLAEVSLTMPENLTTWKVSAWGIGNGARVGQGSADVITSKNLLVRLQTPRFLVERDEVVLSANVHNYLDEAKQVTVRLELEGGTLESPSQLTQQIEVPADGDRRVDWTVNALKEGEATVRAFALTDEESDAMQLKFPVRVHGILKQEAYSGVIALDDSQGAFEFEVPAKRRVEQTRLEVRYSPTLAGAMLDALPYLIDYPHGCTEQTLNRFLPAVITQQTLIELGVDLEAVQGNTTNLNPQELGEAQQRREQWKRFDRSPVFDKAELDKIVRTGVRRLTDMQLSDGGWGWFSGFGEQSTAHTTAVVVRGLRVAQQNDVALLPNVLERGVEWLKTYQAGEIAKLENFGAEGRRIDEAKPAKPKADNLDALVYLTLVENGSASDAMREFLYRDRTSLAVYSLATFGLALHLEPNQVEKRDMLIENVKQYVETDDENQTAWLNLNEGVWWHWYGSEYEAHAYFLKLLAATEPESDLASRLVKYLLNNRKHASYWNSTRDTALVVEGMADYLKATGQQQPDMTVAVWVDGEKRKEVKITAENLFSFDNSLVIEGVALQPGRHTVELRKTGEGRLYYNGYLANFTLEDDIRRAGLEVRVRRALYKLNRVEAEAQVAGQRGQAVGQAVEKYERQPIVNLASVKSGDLVEVELTLESKNDYEYLMITDPKAAGFEPVEVQSGYNGNEIGAYVEYRDATVNLFARTLARGTRSVSYRLRAETPGRFSALPTQIEGMYAPELKGNSDEIKVRVLEGEAVVADE